MALDKKANGNLLVGFVLCCTLLQTNFKIVSGFSVAYQSSELKWASQVLSGQDLSKQAVGSMRSRLEKAMGVSSCEKRPERPLAHNNLAAALGKKSMSGWKGNRLTSSSLSQGLSVVTAHNITSDDAGPQLVLKGLKKGTTYEMTGWVQLQRGTSKDSFLRTFVTYPGQKLASSRIAATGRVRRSCWTKIQGGFTVEQGSQAVLQLGLDKAGASLSIASFSVRPISSQLWRKDQDERINQFRKRRVVLRVRDRSGQPVDAFVEAEQIDSSFPWGGAVSGGFPKDPTFQQWFRRRFQWVVFENELKWFYNERYPGESNFATADDMTRSFRKLNLSIRGHSVFWDPIVNIQEWVKTLSQAQLRQAVNKRIRESVGRYAGQFQHWDINNEYLHGRYFEESLGDVNFGSSVFRKVQQMDPRVQKFINDYNIIEYYYDSLSNPETLLEEAYNIEAAGGKVDGLGLQGHFYEVQLPRLRVELDKLAVGGYPVWVTELDFYDPVSEKQQQYLDLVVRELFAHPAVKGILQWEVARSPCSVYTGVDINKCQYDCFKCLTDESWVDRPLGRVFNALRTEWTTRRSNWVNKFGNLNFRGFFGNYEVRVFYKGGVYQFPLKVPEGSWTFTANITLPVV